jgi:hypothetical protein
VKDLSDAGISFMIIKQGQHISVQEDYAQEWKYSLRSK